MSFPVEKVRADFPVLTREVNGLPLAYLDSAASAQKPNPVVDAEAEFYRHGYAAVHRGIHTLSAEATQRMENVRTQIAAFLNARSPEELVFVRGTTEGINLVANSWGNAQVHAGDNIIITQMEHHANIVPWQMLCERVGAQLRVIPLNLDGTLQLEQLDALLDDRTRLFCQILRDADKIDILRVNVETPMEEIYNVSTAALRRSPVTPAVLDAFYAHHCVLHSLKQYPADNAVGHASLVFELCYPESLRIVDEQGWLWRLLDFKTDNPDTAAAFAAIRDELHRWLNAQSA